MDESDQDKENELTSTTGGQQSAVLDKDEKNDGSDAVPTSSTDTSTTVPTESVSNAADDPISSTSSDNVESTKTVTTTTTTTTTTPGLISPIVSERDLLDINITNISTEKINENVDDIVQDLENLLGEPTSSYAPVIPSIRNTGNVFDEIEAFDNFQLPKIDDFEMIERKLTEPTVENSEPIVKATEEKIEDTREIKVVNSELNSAEVNVELEPIRECSKEIPTNAEDPNEVKVEEVLEENRETDPASEQKSEDGAVLSNEPISVVLEEPKVEESEISIQKQDFLEKITGVLETAGELSETEKPTEIFETPVAENDEIKKSSEKTIEVSQNPTEENTGETENTFEKNKEISETYSGENDGSSEKPAPEITEISENPMEKSENPPEQVIEIADKIPEISDDSIEKISELSEIPCEEMTEKLENPVIPSESLPKKSPTISENLVEKMDESPEEIAEISENPAEKITEVSQVRSEEIPETLENLPEIDEKPIETPKNFTEEITEIPDSPTEKIVDISEKLSEEINETGKPSEIIAEENKITEIEEPAEVIEIAKVSDDTNPTSPIEIIDLEKPSVEITEILEEPPEKITEPFIEPMNKLDLQSTNEEPIDIQSVSEYREEREILQDLMETDPLAETNDLEPLLPIENKDFLQTDTTDQIIALPIVEDIAQILEKEEDTLPTVLPFGQMENKPIDVLLQQSELNEIEQSNLLLPHTEMEEIREEEETSNRETGMSPHEETLQDNEITTNQDDILIKAAQDSQRYDKPIEQPLIIDVDNVEKVDKTKPYSPRITIKPIRETDDVVVVSTSTETESNRGSLKMTITKQSDNTHSILKIYNPDEDIQEKTCTITNDGEQSVPKLLIKSVQSNEQPHSPKLSRSSRMYSPPISQGGSNSPRITIKPILKPDVLSPLKITIKPMKNDEIKQKSSPKLTIKPLKNDEDKIHNSPRVTIKPIVKNDEEQMHSPRITIKPIPKPDNETVPKLTIKAVVKPSEETNPKIIIKPLVKPVDSESSNEMVEDEVKERIVLKINKGNLPMSKESRKRDYVEEEKSEKLAKIKLKISKEDGRTHIVQSESTKRLKLDGEIAPGLTITAIPNRAIEEESTHSEDIEIVEVLDKSMSPIVISEDSAPETEKKEPEPVMIVETVPPPVVLPPAPRKRGRPRKVPLVVREEFKDPKEDEPPPPPQVVVESTRPKRSCRGQSVKTTLGIKPRKPRGPGRGRGSKRGMGTRSTPEPSDKDGKLIVGKLKLVKENFLNVSDVGLHSENDSYQKSPSTSLLAPPSNESLSTDRADIVMYEEETRMSAETSSRAQTPAKQVLTTPIVEIDESQSSVQSTATTESTKARRGPRLEVHQEPEGAVISADQLAEYYWSGGGPFMLQEQVAQFLGIKSFKRKYPKIPRRFVDMQERDFIRESGLASEAMCDLGLTAVNSADILDIMYSDFQDKYEEYCKHQRERQAKDLTNKQRALSLAASQEKSRLDITQQAVQSAANWNTTFNKTRKEQRKASMDLQTLTVHFPKGKIKKINKPKLGNYPVPLVPGQFCDYYEEYTPTELNNLPLNTICYNPVNVSVPEEMDCESQSDGSISDFESSSSYSDTSDSASSDGDNCTLCSKSVSVKKITV